MELCLQELALFIRRFPFWDLQYLWCRDTKEGRLGWYCDSAFSNLTPPFPDENISDEINERDRRNNYVLPSHYTWLSFSTKNISMIPMRECLYMQNNICTEEIFTCTTLCINLHTHALVLIDFLRQNGRGRASCYNSCYDFRILHNRKLHL